MNGAYRQTATTLPIGNIYIYIYYLKGATVTTNTDELIVLIETMEITASVAYQSLNTETNEKEDFVFRQRLFITPKTSVQLHKIRALSRPGYSVLSAVTIDSVARITNSNF